jgi:rhodanese-related sulfurtransferase
MNAATSAALLTALSRALPAVDAAEPAPAIAAPAPASTLRRGGPVAALQDRQASKDATLFVLDVRSRGIRRRSRARPVNVPHDQVAARIAELPKDRQIALYCRSGRRRRRRSRSARRQRIQEPRAPGRRHAGTEASGNAIEQSSQAQ